MTTTFEIIFFLVLEHKSTCRVTDTKSGLQGDGLPTTFKGRYKNEKQHRTQGLTDRSLKQRVALKCWYENWEAVVDVRREDGNKTLKRKWIIYFNNCGETYEGILFYFCHQDETYSWHQVKFTNTSTFSFVLTHHHAHTHTLTYTNTDDTDVNITHNYSFTHPLTHKLNVKYTYTYVHSYHSFHHKLSTQRKNGKAAVPKATRWRICAMGILQIPYMLEA